jgi:ligand-binding SRPBCC domain-containing protein
MSEHVFESEQRVRGALPEVFEFFSRASNLERITPPFLSFALTSEDAEDVHEGMLITYRLKVHGVPLKWVTRIEEFEPGHHFVDRQLKGPYKLWLHRHEFEADGDFTTVRDHVRYALPFGLLGEAAHPLFVRRDIERIFAYRNEAIERIFS